MKKITVRIYLLIFFSTYAFAQTDSLLTAQNIATSPSPLSLSGYAELYYSYDFSEPANHTRPDFIYSHNRHHEVNVNLAFIKASYRKEMVRAHLALMAGTYVNANMASEEGVLKNIFEANAGVKLSQKKNLWLDAGIFPSHLGFESAIGKDCWNLTRSLLADNSPYYESGVKIGYTPDKGKWFISLLYLNGWQRIQRPDHYDTPAFGHQLTYTPNSKLMINSSSFVGSDTPDSTHRMRYFHNFYGIVQLHPNISMTAGFDLGTQQTAKGSSSYEVWYSPVLILKVKATAKWSVAARGEYYHDQNEVIVKTGSPHGFQTFGYSLNADYTLRDALVFRIEGRMLTSKDKIFLVQEKANRNNYFVTTALAVSF